MRRFFLISLVTAILCLTAVTNISAEPVRLDIETCIKLALENNPDFIVSGISLQIAERNDGNTWNNFLPSISLSGSSTGSSALISESPSFSWSASGSVNLSLSLNAGIINSIEATRLAYENEQISYESAKRQLITAVEKEFYYLITSKSSLTIAEANLELAEKNYEQALSNYNHGMTSELSVLQAEINAANLKPAYKQSLSAYNARVRNFLIILGMDPDREIELKGNLDTEIVELNSETLITDLSSRLDLLTMKKNLEILKNNLNLTTLSNKTPTMSLSSSWKVAGLPAYDDSLSFGLSLSVPLDDFIPGSSTSLSLASISDQIRQTEIKLQNAEKEARTEIFNLIEQLETAADNIKISTMNIELAKKTYEMSEESFARGLIERLNVEDAQQSYLSAKNQYLSSQYTYLTTLISLRDAAGLKTIEELYSIGETNK